MNAKERQEEYRQKLKMMASEERFDEISVSFSPSRVSKVDENFRYLPDSIPFKIFALFIRFIFIILAPLINFFNNMPKIIGRNHLKGVKSAITVSNHVFYLDNAVVRQAVFGHKLYVTVAPFNCKKGLGGLILRAGGILPFSENFTATKNLYSAMEKLLKKGAYVHFYPEQSMWLGYEKTRPLKKAAFSVAVKNNVPVIPMFFVFRDRRGLEKLFGKKKIAILKITEPIFPDENLTHGQNVERMKELAESAYKRIVIEHYGYDEKAYDIRIAP